MLGGVAERPTVGTVGTATPVGIAALVGIAAPIGATPIERRVFAWHLRTAASAGRRCGPGCGTTAAAATASSGPAAKRRSASGRSQSDRR